MGITFFNVCDGVRDCARRCAERTYGMEDDCGNDEDPAKCSPICPRGDGYPKRADIWSATHLCYHNETKLPMCSIPCNGVKECPGEKVVKIHFYSVILFKSYLTKL